MIRHDSVAPDTFSLGALRALLVHYTEAADAIGYHLHTTNTEDGINGGWTRDNMLDHDGFMALGDGANVAARNHAKLNNLFYNSEKLADVILDILVEAYEAGWDRVYLSAAEAHYPHDREPSLANRLEDWFLDDGSLVALRNGINEFLVRWASATDSHTTFHETIGKALATNNADVGA